jgi:6,7-dimethyl-8-ribityllumazine synthase
MEADKSQIGIVVSTYNSNITRRLREGAIKTFQAAGFESSQLLTIDVPGAWELPLACRQLVQRLEVQAVVALGAVIRGETSHDQHINRAVSNALMDLMMTTGKPVGFGLLTCNTMEQAIQRAGGNVGNKGQETAEAVLDMLKLKI